MKFLVLALFVAVAAAAPTPEANGEPVELIVHGVPEGQPLELGDVVDIKLKEHQNGELASSVNLLHPLTAAGIAEAAAAAEAAQPEIIPSPVQIVDVAEPESAIVPEPEAVPEVIAVIPIPESGSPDTAPEVIAVIPIPESGYEANPDNIAVIPIPGGEVSAPEVAPIELLPPAPPMVITEPEVEPIELLPPIPPVVITEPEADPSPVVLEPLPEPAPQVPNGEVFNNGMVQVQVNAPEDPSYLSTIQSWFSMFVNYISNGIQTSQQIV